MCPVLVVTYVSIRAVDMVSDPKANWNWLGGYDQVWSKTIPQNELSDSAKEAVAAGKWFDNSDAAKLSGGLSYQRSAVLDTVKSNDSKFPSSAVFVNGSHCFGDTYRVLCQRLRDYLQANHPNSKFSADCVNFTGSGKPLMEDADDGVIDEAILSQK